MNDFWNDWGEAIVLSFTNALTMLTESIPRILGFLLILVIGWLVSGVLASAVVGLLRAVRFNEASERSGFSRFVNNMGVRRDAASVVADGVKWFVRLIVLVVAFDALGLPAVSQVLRELLLWLPNAVVALVILVIGGLLANFASDLVRGATAQAGLGNSGFFASLVRFMIWGFAIVVAVNQIGIASTLVNTLFTAFVGALALALGLAFGLGGRETAAEIIQGWYARRREMRAQLKATGEAADEQLSAAAQRRRMAPTGD